MHLGTDPVAAPSILASEVPSQQQKRAALGLCLAIAMATVTLLPLASWTGYSMPGFVAINQTALVIAYGLSAWVLFVQFLRGRSLPLLLVAGGTLFTAAIVFLQLLSFPGVASGGRILGSGPETTTWLWTFWHIGPPACALAYALAIRRSRTLSIAPEIAGRAAAIAILIALGTAAIAAVASTWGLPWLPQQTAGNDYRALITSGIGPAVQLLTITALLTFWYTTRVTRNVLELWLGVSLVLLILDNFLTMAGAARGSLGWYAGRVEATASAFVILAVYLHEVDALRARAEAVAHDLAQAEATLRQAQKMEAVGRLTGGVAHDFNNLLMVMTSGFDTIRRRPDDHARVVKTAEAGLEAANRGARLTRQLLTFARRQDLHPETINANASLLDFEPLARRAVGEAIGLDFDLHPALYPTRIDRSEFEAAVLNLIVNARDAVSPQNGRIILSTRNAIRGGEAAPELEDAPAGQYVVVSVADNGSGMDETTRNQAFEPFFTTKEFGRGSGLGLSQVYGFARGMGGAVKIVSQPGQGTTVEIWLPQAESGRPATTISKSSIAPLRRAEIGETVLAVEDDPPVLAAVIENLTDLGYRAIPARDAAEALELLRSPTRVDILFSDVVMPGGMNGVQLAVEARQLRPGLRALLTSGYTNDAWGGDHRVPADVPVLTKPYRREQLAQHLQLVPAPERQFA